MAIITGVLWNPVGGLTRYIGGLWLLAALLLDTMYRSNLKAMLTIQRANIPFNNVEELADSNIPIAIYKDSTADLQIMVRFGFLCCNKNSRYSLYSIPAKISRPERMLPKSSVFIRKFISQY